MLKNYFKTAFRNLWRNKNFTFINIAGLSVGIAVCLVIFVVIHFEQSFDTFHSKKNRIYRVLTQFHTDDGFRLTAGVPYPLADAMHVEFPGMKSTGIYNEGDAQILVMDEKTQQVQKKFREERGMFFAEPGFFQIFDFPLIAGEYTSLSQPNTAVITKETAERYFSDWRSAIGRSFRQGQNGTFRIVGILADPPPNSDFQLKIVASFVSLHTRISDNANDWVSVDTNNGCYILLPEGMDAAAMNRQLKAFVKKYKTGEAQDRPQVVQSLAKVHFDEEPGNFSRRTISKGLINTLWLIAMFILLIACVNFVNLSTAQAVNRSKEVAIRKVMGSNRMHLRFQFFSETAIITLFAVLLSIFIAAISLSGLKSILNLPIDFDIRSNPYIILFLGAVAVIVILLAGFYPALVLSRFNPIVALKNKVAVGKAKGISLRRGLVVFQFVIAQALIIGTLISVQQMELFKKTPVGFDREAIVNVSFPDDSLSKKKLDYLKNRLLAVQGVKSVSFSFASPADDGNWSSRFSYDNAIKEPDWSANLKWADADYLKTYSLQLVAGRNVAPSDTVREFLVNETLLKRLGVKKPEDALNKNISMWDNQLHGPIVGVMKDFNALSLRKGLVPVLVSTMKGFYGIAGIKMETSKIPSALKATEALWNEVYPDYVYEPQFLDAKIESFYVQEDKLSSLYKIFAALAIFLSCLGLYGLASFMAVQRVKEVGIRKVLGASVKDIIVLFSKEFLVLIAIAFVVAAPLAWFYMHDWLQDFVYRVSISWYIVVMAGFIALFIALCTISFQALKAAFANPVKSLRTE